MLFIREWACIGLLLLCMGRMHTVKLHQRIQGMGILHPQKKAYKKRVDKKQGGEALPPFLEPPLLYWDSSIESPPVSPPEMVPAPVRWIVSAPIDTPSASSAGRPDTPSVGSWKGVFQLAAGQVQGKTERKDEKVLAGNSLKVLIFAC